MSFWVIKRRAKGNGSCYVSPPGHKFSYVRDVLRARRFTSEEAARAALCPDNETVVEIRLSFNRSASHA